MTIDELPASLLGWDRSVEGRSIEILQGDRIRLRQNEKAIVFDSVFAAIEAVAHEPRRSPA